MKGATMSNDLDLGLGLDTVPTTETAFEAGFYKGKSEYAGPFYTINIAHVEHLPEFETIGVNGEVLQIQRGEDVPNIPKAFVDVLKNAIASRQVKKVRPDQTEFFEWQPYPAIPYQIVEGPYQTRK
jgi:hypothetical protein